MNCRHISSSPPKIAVTVKPYSQSVLVYVSSHFDNSEAFDNARRNEGNLINQDVHEIGTSEGDCNHMVRGRDTINNYGSLKISLSLVIVYINQFLILTLCR